MLPEKPPVLPSSIYQAIDWYDFSQTYNPLGTPEPFVAAMHAISKTSTHEGDLDKTFADIKTLLAQRYGVRPENVAVGTTPKSILEAVAKTFEQTSICVPIPSRETYTSTFKNAGHKVIHATNPEGFVTPEPDVAQKLNEAFDAAVLANPTYPTSRLLPRHTLRAYLHSCIWVLVDERGVDLTMDGESAATMVGKYDNLILLESFTDVYSMPGLPISCALANEALANKIQQNLKPPEPFVLIRAFAEMSLTLTRQLEITTEVLEREIPWMQCMLSLIPGITIYPAEANYVMCAYNPAPHMQLGATSTVDLVRKLQQHGFLVRELTRTPGIEPGSRICISVRSHTDNERFINTMRNIVQNSKK